MAKFIKKFAGSHTILLSLTEDQANLALKIFMMTVDYVAGYSDGR